MSLCNETHKEISMRAFIYEEVPHVALCKLDRNEGIYMGGPGEFTSGTEPSD